MSGSAIRRAAVVDIGSNTIKILVGEALPGGGVVVLHDQSVECRISRGMYKELPRFTGTAMREAARAVRTLLEGARPFEPRQVEILATSAVRDAENRDDFVRLIDECCGRTLRILTGAEEAAGIARGIAVEPDLDPGADYTVADLGGGSLEWIHSRGGGIAHLASLDLGAVRLLHRFVPDPAAPLPPSAAAAIRDFCLDVFARSLPRLGSGPGRRHWGTGGAFTITRLLLAGESGRPLPDQSNEIPLRDIRRLSKKLAALDLEDRKSVPGLPPPRADILPVALVVLEALASHTGADRFYHSFHNLRMGRLAMLLEK
ncbi:MAG: Ppx/GppA phosphatase family protein [Puniceicoccaceae bacterium]